MSNFINQCKPGDIIKNDGGCVGIVFHSNNKHAPLNAAVFYGQNALFWDNVQPAHFDNTHNCVVLGNILDIMEKLK